MAPALFPETGFLDPTEGRLDRRDQPGIDPDHPVLQPLVQPEGPAEAILPDTESGAEDWLELNREYSEKWPNITRQGTAPEDSAEWDGKSGKKELFSPNPGSGD
mgnify:CR=1 FL=1